jgi:hypothetical protein
MNKKDLKLLERVFEREIFGLSLQSKSKEYERLEQDGYVFIDKEMKHFKDGFPPMKIIGWRLTHKGRIEYCWSCE